ncbi:MAG TPA: formylglycine-generating enzyme family protein, partial [Accumulibacter sp.]|nr:formylglycine-generating enzyme family protein [Accumulibacter sp.]
AVTTATPPPSPTLAEAAERHPLLPALLARLACCVRVEPGLLRALRRLDAASAAEPGLEALLWAYAPVVAAGSRFCEIAAPWRGDCQAAFSRLAAGEQRQILRRVLEAHAWRGRATESAKILLWHAHAKPAAADPEAIARLGEARGWFRRFKVSAPAAIGDPAGYAQDLFARHGGDHAWLAAHSAELAPLWARTGSDEIPAGLRAADVIAARGSGGTSVLGTWRLQQQNDRFVLEPAVRPAPPGRWPTVHLAGGAVCRWLTDAGWRQRWLAPAATPMPLPDAHAAEVRQIALHSGRRRYHFARQDRPPWARELGRDGYGLYLDVDFSSDDRGIVQRFRWIEPGEFWMGSPEDEAKRDDHEGPRHRVRLTQGFWLADTACTQALWRAVMGSKNPRRFQDDERNPVEKVSWDDAEAFLQRITSRLPGMRAGLPSEAEWEYACRAGSDTPFNSGTTISAQQANYDGNFPYAGGEKGAYWKKTVPVKTFSPNAWGLYEMHGNVWEWCADGRRPYDGEPQENPRGPENPATPRVVRGGSWYNEARRLRSAYRNQGHRVHRLVDQGFRFVLRSTSPEPAAGAERLSPGDGVARDA